MPATLRVNTRVLPGKRIEITAPELQEGENVEVVILRRDASQKSEFMQTMEKLWASMPPVEDPEEAEEFILNEVMEHRYGKKHK